MAKKATAVETVEVAPQEVVTKTPPKPAKDQRGKLKIEFII